MSDVRTVNGGSHSLHLIAVAAVPVLVVEPREELQIARDTRAAR